jgi:hypothetical protein
MAEILPFPRRYNVFDPDATLAMGEAYDRAIAANADVQSQFVVRELIAKRIIRKARKGVFDRDQLSCLLDPLCRAYIRAPLADDVLRYFNRAA